MKKGLTLLLAAVMLLTVVTVNASAAGFADTEGTKCETAVTVLSALGIVEGNEEGVFAPDSSLTRAEMATIILRAMNMAGLASGRDIFTDVPASHWAYANIATAYQLGFVNGTSDTTYAPDVAVTYEQGVKMVVAALGYTVQAEAMGGYPSGYLSKAAQLDILRGVKTGGEISRGDMAILLYNALDVELLQKTAYGEESYAFASNEAATLLSWYLKVNKVVDVIGATPMGILEAPSRRLLSDEVSVGSPSVIMKKGETNAQDLLGVRCEIYTKHDADMDIPVIIAAVPRSGVAILEIKAQDIDSVSGGRILYTDAEGKEQQAIVSGAAVLLNGRRVTAPTDADLMPAIGRVRLVANGGDYTLAIVESYQNHVVKSVNREDAKVTFKDNTQITLDLSDNSIATVFTDGAGKALTLDDLQEWDVVSIAQDDAVNPTIRRIYRSYQMAAGTISEISSDTVTIGDKVYPIAPSLDVTLLKLGQAAGYYLDFTGAVAAVDTNYEKGYSYGWAKHAEYSKGVDGKLQLKLFTQEGKWEILTLADTIKYNGTSVRSAAVEAPDTERGNDVYKDGHAPQLFDADGNFVPQLIAYAANSNNEITELHTAQNLTNPDPAVYEDEDKIGSTFSMDWYANNAPGAYSGGYVSRFNGTAAGDNVVTGNNESVANVFFGRVVQNDRTKIFSIPKDTEDDKLYKMRTALGMQTWRDTGCISFYDVSDSYLCGAIVIRNDLAGVGSSDEYPESGVASAIVTGVSKVLNEDGVPVTALKMKSYTGADVTAKVEDPDFNCLYCFVNADLAKDPDWYGVKVSDSSVTYNYTNVSDLLALSDHNPAMVSMYLPVSRLQPGDVIQYQLDDYGNLTMANVCFRGNYGGGVEFTAKISSLTESIAASTKNNYYNGGALLVHGNVKEVYDTGIYVKVNLGDTEGQKTANTAVHAMKKSGTFYVWDREKQTLTTITADDVLPGDEIFTIWATDVQRMFIVYRPTADVSN